MSVANVAEVRKPDPEQTKSALSKVTKHLMPILLVMYVVAFLDRSNIGWAQQEWEASAGISGAAYAFGATLFFIGYAIFEVPSNLLMHKVGARWWMTRIMVSWGIVAVCFMFVNSVTSFYILRFLLGVAEAGFFPGVILYLTYWYPAAKRGWATGLFYAGLPLANVIGNPLSGSLLELHGFLGLMGHQWMFIVEGGLAIIVGCLIPKLLTDRPEKAHWLSEEERTSLAAQIELEEDLKEEAEPISWKKALVNPRILYFCLIYMCIQASVYGLTFFLPKQVTELTGQAAGFQASLVTAIPWACALVAVIFIPKIADRTMGYQGFSFGMLLLSGAGMTLSALTMNSVFLSMLGLSLAAIGFVCAQPIFWQLPTRYLSGAALAGATGLINAVGNLGGWLSPNVRTWAAESAFGSPSIPNESAGLLVLAIFGFLGAVLVVGLRLFRKSSAEKKAQRVSQELAK